MIYAVGCGTSCRMTRISRFNRNRQARFPQMHAVCACGERHVHSIVHQQAASRAGGEGNALTHECREFASGEIRFPNLHSGHSAGDRPPHLRKQQSGPLGVLRRASSQQSMTVGDETEIHENRQSLAARRGR